MLGPFGTASRLTPIHQMSLAVLLRAACAPVSTTTTTTTRDRGDHYGPMEWAQLHIDFIPLLPLHLLYTASELWIPCWHWGLMRPRNIVDYGAVDCLCVCSPYHLLPFASCRLASFISCLYYSFVFSSSFMFFFRSFVHLLIIASLFSYSVEWNVKF